MKPTLFIFGGLPGTGKTTLALALARHYGAVFLRVDTIEQAMRNSNFPVGGPRGYEVGYALAVDNLSLGQNVVADSVNPLNITREAWKKAAGRAEAEFLEIEIVCSDTSEHRSRVESRPADRDGLKLPSWADVESRRYEEWRSARLVVDTARQDASGSIAELLHIVASIQEKKK